MGETKRALRPVGEGLGPFDRPKKCSSGPLPGKATRQRDHSWNNVATGLAD
jgi:hypothetical protein